MKANTEAASQNYFWPKIAVFCYVAPCTLVETGRTFGDAYSLHHQTNEKSVIDKIGWDKGAGRIIKNSVAEPPLLKAN
jgi:hypothetical protein